MVTVQTQEYNCDQLFRARSIILGIPELNNNHILPLNTNGLFDLSTYYSIHFLINERLDFDLDQTSTFISDLSCKFFEFISFFFDYSIAIF